MKTHLVLATIAACPVIQANGPKSGSPDIHIPLSSRKGWEVGVGVAPIFGAETRFSGLGQWQSPNPIPPPAGTADRLYDDGFNRIDNTGNAENLTSFWGYQNESQYNPNGDGSIALSIFNSRRAGAASDDDTGWGGEVFASRELGDLGGLFGTDARWGIRLGLHGNRFSFRHRGNLATSLDVITDNYDLGGSVPPEPPFSGNPSGFGTALLSDQPVRSASVQTAGIAGSRELEVTLFGFTAGSYLELPIGDRAAIRAEGGLSLAIARGRYSDVSMTTVTDVGTQTWGESSRETDLLPGLYLGVTGIFQVNDALSIYSGLRYQFYDSFEIRAGGSRAKLDFSEAFMFTLGGSFAF